MNKIIKKTKNKKRNNPTKHTSYIYFIYYTASENPR